MAMKMHELFEAPISDISHVGNWEKNSSYGTQDRALLNNPKAVQKIKSMWKYPQESMFNVILVNHADARLHSEIGIVTPEWLAKEMPRVWPDIQPLIKANEINIIFTGNSADQRVPMTGWVMAHRFGHAMEANHRRNTPSRSWGGMGTDPSKGQKTYLFGEAYNTFIRVMMEIMEAYGMGQPPAYSYSRLPTNGPLRGFLHAVCTFRAARESNIRNPLEVLFECLAQYMLTGKVRFNPAPKGFRYGRNYYAVRDEDYQQHAQNELDGLAYMLEEYFEHAIGNLEGQILVM